VEWENREKSIISRGIDSFERDRLSTRGLPVAKRDIKDESQPIEDALVKRRATSSRGKDVVEDNGGCSCLLVDRVVKRIRPKSFALTDMAVVSELTEESRSRHHISVSYVLIASIAAREPCLVW